MTLELNLFSDQRHHFKKRPYEEPRQKYGALVSLRNYFSFGKNVEWHITVCRLPQWGISEHKTVNQAQMLIEALHLI
jgi:hypothetical protein